MQFSFIITNQGITTGSRFILLERGYSEDFEVYLVCLSRKKSRLFITKIFSLEISFYERFYILKKFYSAEKMNLLFFFLK